MIKSTISQEKTSWLKYNWPARRNLLSFEFSWQGVEWVNLIVSRNAQTPFLCYFKSTMVADQNIKTKFFLTYKCTSKPLLGISLLLTESSLDDLDLHIFNIVIPENWKLQKIKLLKFLQVLLTVSVIIFSDIIFRFAVYCFNQQREQCKGFFERKMER